MSNDCCDNGWWGFGWLVAKMEVFPEKGLFGTICLTRNLGGLMFDCRSFFATNIRQVQALDVKTLGPDS